MFARFAGRASACLLPCILLCAARPAHAYRPFDETDAAVSEPNELELELGPIGYTRDAYGGALTPGFILNYGVVPRLELVFDAHHALLFRGVQLGTRRRALDTGLLAKVVTRQGCLQGKPGVSSAIEAGALLPTVPAAGRPGLALTVIASKCWSEATLHVDLENDLSREGTYGLVIGAIVEGPSRWTVRPVIETVLAGEAHAVAVSALGGAIWRATEYVAVDAAVRAARQGAIDIYEVRVGFTWRLEL